MTDIRPLRVGLFTHSTNPRGGVVHVLSLGEALAARGHHVVVHAPDESGKGFFRPVNVGQSLVPAAPTGAGLESLVRQRVDEYVAHLLPRGCEFDVYHAHDGISGRALSELTERGVIPGFIRTVHHLDEFDDPYLRQAQDRSVMSALRCLCVSRVWQDRIRQRYGLEAAVVPNGVDLARFHPGAMPQDQALRERLLRAGPGPVFLSVGGIERRKNALNILRAFVMVRQEFPRAVLLIAGGASLLDHSAYRREFEQLLAFVGPEVAQSVIVTGPLSEDEMPAAYRLADALVFPSVTEGFGLAVLEALACGTPVVTSNIAPFTEYLTDKDALLVDPTNVAGIAAAMQRVVDAHTRAGLRDAGLAVSRRFPWSATALAHEREYRNSPKLKGDTTHAGDAVPSAVAG
jgi:glycosyltransferase-like protein